MKKQKQIQKHLKNQWAGWVDVEALEELSVMSDGEK